MTYKDKVFYASSPICTDIHCDDIFFARCILSQVQGREDPHKNPEGAGYFPQKWPLISGLFCAKWRIKIKQSMGLRYPVPRRVVDRHIWNIRGTGWRRVIWDASSLWVSFRKRSLQLVALLRKMTCNLRHPMSLCHPDSRFPEFNRGCVTWLIHTVISYDSSRDMTSPPVTWLPLPWHDFPSREPSISRLQGGEDSQDASSCSLFLVKEPLIIGLFCGKWPMKIRNLMTLRHPVCRMTLRHTVSRMSFHLEPRKGIERDHSVFSILGVLHLECHFSNLESQSLL